MDEEEIEELLRALDTLNKYRNYWYKSDGFEERVVFKLIDDFLPKVYNIIIKDELVALVRQKINQKKKNGRKR